MKPDAKWRKAATNQVNGWLDGLTVEVRGLLSSHDERALVDAVLWAMKRRDEEVEDDPVR